MEMNKFENEEINCFSRQILTISGAHLDSNHPFHQEMKGLERPVLKVRRFTHIQVPNQ